MLTHVIAGLSGSLMKIYDDVVDNPEVYSNIFANKLGLEFIMIACISYCAYLDPFVLFTCIFTFIVDILLYTYNLYYPVLNVNYAFDKTSWKIGICIIIALLIYKGSTIFESFTSNDYLIILAGFAFIFIDAIYLVSTDKKIIDDPYNNMIHLEASDKKLIARIILFFSSLISAIEIQYNPFLYEHFHKIQYIFTWGIFYFLTSYYNHIVLIKFRYHTLMVHPNLSYDSTIKIYQLLLQGSPL